VYTKIQVVFDAADPAKLAAFWKLALGYDRESPPEGYATWEDFGHAIGLPQERFGDQASLVDPGGEGSRIYFQRVPGRRRHRGMAGPRPARQVRRHARPRRQRVLRRLTRPAWPSRSIATRRYAAATRGSITDMFRYSAGRATENRNIPESQGADAPVGLQ
jgi:hypothetical protein